MNPLPVWASEMCNTVCAVANSYLIQFGKPSAPLSVTPVPRLPSTISAALPLKTLDTDGVIYIAAGYAWDGPSGPALDTPSAMRGSLVHDALYQLMRERMLDVDKWREASDDTMMDICKADGMWAPRRGWFYVALRTFARGSAVPQKAEVLTAP